MKKKILASLAFAAMALGSTASHAALASCDDPLTSAIGQRFCAEVFDNLTPGAYNVSFEYQAEKFSGNGDKNLTFGFLFDNLKGADTRGVLHDSTATAGWNTYSFVSQIGGDASLIFALRGVPSTNFGMSLQNIQVAAVPEPATYAMMLAGLGAIVFVSRRRRL
jgi:hypothetical protein